MYVCMYIIMYVLTYVRMYIIMYVRTYVGFQVTDLLSDNQPWWDNTVGFCLLQSRLFS